MGIEICSLHRSSACGLLAVIGSADQRRSFAEKDYNGIQIRECSKTCGSLKKSFADGNCSL